jgi:hypothetical protein
MSEERRQEQNHLKWTVMVYLAGDNNLGEECVYALTEMQKVVSNNEMAVIAQLDASVLENTRIHIKPNTKPGALNDELKKLSNQQAQQNAGKPGGANQGRQQKVRYSDILYEFVEYCIKNFSADHYMLVLSGHSSGTVGAFLSKDVGNETVSLSIIDLGKLIERINKGLFNGRKLDILGLDSCLMSMSEVAYVVHNHVKVMLGAQGFEPMAGWPYGIVLSEVKKLCAEPDGGTDEDLKLLAKRIVCGYIKHYTDYQAAGLSVDQAACDLSQCVTLMRAVKSLSLALLNYFPDPESGKSDTDREVRNALLLSHWEAQLYKNEQYTDLYDFCTLLKSNCIKDDVRRACQNVLNAIRGSQNEPDADMADDNFTDQYGVTDFRNRDEVKGFILKSCYSGWAVQYSYGVSIYFPWAEIPADLGEYSELYFSRDAAWVRFLRAYLSATQRAPRLAEAELEDARSFTPNLILADYVTGANNDAFGWSANRFGTQTRFGTQNKYGTQTKDLSNAIGSMRNPPTKFRDCSCDVEATSNDKK